MKKLSAPKIVAFLFLLIMALIWVIPLAYAFFSSFKIEADIQSMGFYDLTGTLGNGKLPTDVI